jgi:hypothetical protein
MCRSLAGESKHASRSTAARSTQLPVTALSGDVGQPIRYRTPCGSGHDRSMSGVGWLEHICTSPDSRHQRMPARPIKDGNVGSHTRHQSDINADDGRHEEVSPTHGRGMHACTPDSTDEGTVRPESMQGSQVGGGRHGDAPMTELEHPLDFMPVKHMPDRLSQLECLKARIWVRSMMVPASVSGSPPRLAGSPTSARRPSLWTSASMASAVMESQARFNER